jgi:histidyl-tRNA synthetase
VGTAGVKGELEGKGYEAASINNLIEIFENGPFTIEKAKALCGEEESIQSIEYILDSVKAISGGSFEVVYDLTLIRGQGYYTGTVFEIESTKFRGAIAGGGRYDNLIGKFLNESVPAVGFSIGFERIFGILMDMEYEIPNKTKKVAYLFEEKDFIEAMNAAEEQRSNYEVAMFVKPKKVGKFIDKLEAQGFDGFFNWGQSEEINFFQKNK